MLRTTLVGVMALAILSGCQTPKKSSPPPAPVTTTTQAAAKPATTSPQPKSPAATPTTTAAKPGCKSGTAATQSIRKHGLVEIGRSVTFMPPETPGICNDLQVHARWFEATFAADGVSYEFANMATRSERFPGVGDQPVFIDEPEGAACADTVIVVYTGSATFNKKELPKIEQLHVTGELSARTIAATYQPALADC